jgi:hypothetical protein
MSFSLVRRSLCRALRTGAYGHVPRGEIEAKNWLSTGRVSRQEVVELLLACTPANYRLSDHHGIPRIKVHEFTVNATVADHTRWYLKFFFQPSSPVQGWKVYSIHPST